MPAMASLPELIQSGTSSAWLFVPTAVLLGALHGLEPGHSKTMMAAFIVAVRGTVAQAILLGLAATVSHTAVVWAVAMGGLYFGRNLDAEASEPYFQVASAALIIAIALWMLWRTWRQSHRHHHAHDHPDIDAHDRAHAEDIRRRFGGAAHVTTAQIIAFGLTGGLIPCPAAITVLLLCFSSRSSPSGPALCCASASVLPSPWSRLASPPHGVCGTQKKDGPGSPPLRSALLTCRRP